MDFSARELRILQKESINSYEKNLKSDISHCLKQRAKLFPYSNKFTLVFADKTREEESTESIDQSNFFYVSMNIFDRRMFDSIADWLARLGYMARKHWFEAEHNNNGEIASISLSW